MSRILGPITRDHQGITGLIDNPPAELWDDGRHNLSEVPGNAFWWLAVEDGAPVALGAVWQEPDGTWRSGCNAEIGWRSRPEQARHWPDLHAARQTWLTGRRSEISRIVTWLHDVEGAPAGTSNVVRAHLDSGWTLTGQAGTLDGGRYARQLELRP